MPEDTIKIRDEYVGEFFPKNIDGGKISIDGWFTVSELRQIADALEKYQNKEKL